MKNLKIATRKSPLALWQANHVKQKLLQLFPNMTITLVTFVTQGDKILDVPLAKVGGKGLFVKELEHALLNGDADIAVHSTKDLPMDLPQGLNVPVFMQREDPTDAFVSNQYSSIDALPHQAVIGTSSLRRQTQLQAYRPDLVIKSVRGNVGTRLNKLDSGDYDAIILATSGLKRLGLTDRITSTLKKSMCLPAVGQGVLGIECRANDDAVLSIISQLTCAKTSYCVLAERAMNQHLQGGCQVPIAGHATIAIDQPTKAVLTLKGLVANVDGSVILTHTETATIDMPATFSLASVASKISEQLGIDMAKKLLAQGAGDILASFYQK